jgi:phosphoribosylglycinamide formyltransferase 1
MKLLIFASGNGSNFGAIAEAVSKKELKAEIAGLVVDRDCYAMERARSYGITVKKVDAKEHRQLLDTIKGFEPDYLVLAGYMRLIPSSIIDEYPLRIINIHPSLLPSFPGKDAIMQAWKARACVTGVTVHFVNDAVDQGPVLAQEPVRIGGYPNMEELEKQIHRVEHKLYVDAISSLINDKFDTLVVSSCLLGDNCRYDGGNKFSARAGKIVKAFNGKIIKLCPELAAGFSVPRQRIELSKGRAIMENAGDVTDKINAGILKLKEAIGKPQRVLALLKEKSPSCGVVNPMGLFTLMLRDNFRVMIVSEKEI